jgi:pyroglutamyl-peptidase
MTTVLITGFGPFHGAAFNPSGPLARVLAKRRRPAFAGVKLVSHVFPTSYAAVDRELPKLLEKHRPKILLMFGVATRTPHVRIETRARNARSPLFADVDGVLSVDGLIAKGKPAAMTGRAPFHRLLGASRAVRVPTALSRDAGRYLCNYGYWRGLEGLSHDDTALVQFVHIPALHAPRPLSRVRRRRVTHTDLVRAGEAILLTLMAAQRR